MQCIGLKLTGAYSAPAPYAVLCSTCVACKSSAVPLAPHTTHLARAVVFPTFSFGCAVRTTSACAERHAQRPPRSACCVLTLLGLTLRGWAAASPWSAGGCVEFL